MISHRLAKIISCMPKGMGKYITKSYVNNHIKKYANIKINGKENLKEVKSPTIFICNHLSNSDGAILHNVLEAYDPAFVAGIKLSSDPATNLVINLYKNVFIKPNSADKEAIKNIINLLKSGESIVIFPEGTRSRDCGMLESKKGILLIAKLSKVPIVPIAIWGTEKLLPISKDGDMSIEKFQYADVNLSIGEKVNLPQRDSEEDKKVYEERALNFLMHNIAKQLPKKYRGVYDIND